MSDWKVTLHDQFPAYISWEQYLRNRERLLQNRTREDTRGNPRNGSALLAGLVFCGNCGQRMCTVYRYADRPRYDCSKHVRRGEPRVCRGLNGTVLDAVVAEQVLRAITPASIELSLQAMADVELERDRLHTHWHQELERARYEAQKAERAYRAVDPENRLVARTLEQQWEEALHHERNVQDNVDRFQRETPRQLTPAEQDRIRALATDIPSLWQSAEAFSDRKEIIRCLVNRVTVKVEGQTENVVATIHWIGGTTSQHPLQRPVQRYEQLTDFPRLHERVTAYKQDGLTLAQIAERLNEEGFRPPSARATRFTERLIGQLMYRLGLGEYQPRTASLAADEWWFRDLAQELGIAMSRLRHWLKKGYVHSRKVGRGGHFVVWADADELSRLRRLRDFVLPSTRSGFPAELTCPMNRPRTSTDGEHDVERSA